VKKFLIISALALGLAAVVEQEASAWIKCNFSVGLNWSWESGNNSFLWGAWTSGQVPGWPTDAWNGTHANPSPYTMMGGGPVVYGDHGGYPPPGPHGDNGFVAPPPGQTAEPPAGKGGGTPPPPQPTTTGQYGTNGYQPVGYYQAPASYYQAPNYSTPSYGYYGGQGYYGYGSYGNYQVPSYWYGY
jgi:hypothetical protein